MVFALLTALCPVLIFLYIYSKRSQNSCCFGLGDSQSLQVFPGYRSMEIISAIISIKQSSELGHHYFQMISISLIFSILVS